MQRLTSLVLHKALRQVSMISGPRKNAPLHALRCQGVWDSVYYLVTLVMAGGWNRLISTKTSVSVTQFGCELWFMAVDHVLVILFVSVGFHLDLAVCRSRSSLACILCFQWEVVVWGAW